MYFATISVHFPHTLFYWFFQPKKRVLVRPNSISSGKENGSSAKEKTEESQDQSATTGKKVIKLSGVSVKEVGAISFSIKNYNTAIQLYKSVLFFY